MTACDTGAPLANEPDLVLRYAEHDDGVIDVYLPAADRRPAPLVVALHGGYWRVAYDRTYLQPFGRSLADAGCAVALPEFRRVGAGGEWPVIGQDVITALATVRDTVRKAAPGAIDQAAPYQLLGHSAGGHLALWAGLQAGHFDCERIIALAPVADLREAARRHLSNDAAAELLGGVPDAVPEAYADADPLTMLPTRIPVTVVHGDADTDVPVELSRALVERHPEIDYLELAGVDHFQPIDPGTAVFRTVVLPLIRR